MAIVTVEGIFRDGKVELTERPPGVAEPARVLVTFLPDPDAEARAELARNEAGQQLLALLAEGIPLGGPPYPEREEIYEQRINRYRAGDG